MEEMSLGPNGGLIFCFEFLLDHLEDFLSAEIETITEDYLIIIDMPGQIELYTHVPIVPALVKHLIREGSLGINLCAAYLIESTFVMDRAKFFAGTLSAMSAMLMLEVPHINILSKIDLVKGNVPRKELKRFIDPDSSLINDDPSISAITIQPPGTSDATASDLTEIDPLAAPSLMHGKSFKRLNTAVAQLVEEYGMVSFLQLDVQSEDSVGAILSYIDDVIQFHEAQEPREPNDEVDFDYGD